MLHKKGIELSSASCLVHTGHYEGGIGGANKEDEKKVMVEASFAIK